MKYKGIILSSELDFREYLIQNFENISKIFIFEDSLDNIIYFYCFFNNYIFIATKEKLEKTFFYYKNLYNQLAQEYKFKNITKSNQEKVLKLKK